MRPTYLTIDTSLVRENLRKIKDSLPEWSTSTAVIKANGYGHGSVMMGRIAVEEGYESLAVAIPEESVPLRNAGIMVPIYLLGLTRPQSFELVADTNSIPAVCESTDLEALNKVADNHDMIIRVAVAVDTGMHRIGIKPEDAVEFIKRVESYPNLAVDGFFSHMSMPMQRTKAMHMGKPKSSIKWWTKSATLDPMRTIASPSPTAPAYYL